MRDSTTERIVRAVLLHFAHLATLAETHAGHTVACKGRRILVTKIITDVNAYLRGRFQSKPLQELNCSLRPIRKQINSDHSFHRIRNTLVGDTVLSKQIVRTVSSEFVGNRPRWFWLTQVNLQFI